MSYFGINQWQVASLQPPHLAAMCIWEGAADFYRDMTHHGGILSTFWANWSDMQVKTVQFGIGERGGRSQATGQRVCGDDVLSDDALAANRCDFGRDIRSHPLDDGYHQARSPDWDNVVTPFLSAANWGGQGLHPRGNFEGFVRARSEHKWLESHGLEHWTHFYTDYGRDLQKRFFDRFLKGRAEAWPDQPRVRLQVRRLDGFEPREASAWPLPGTVWTPFHLDLSAGALSLVASAQPCSVSFDALGEGLTFLSAPLHAETEVTGPIAVSLHVSSTTTDADIFVVVRLFDPDMKEITFQGAIDPHTPIAQGWLRASHRALDETLSRPYRPYHRHDRAEPLTPGEVVALQIEVWPTSIVVPKGYRIGLSLRGRDYENVASGGRLSNFKNELRGCGPFLHDDPQDRPLGLFGGVTTVHVGPDHPSYMLVPIIPRGDGPLEGGPG